jgi:hypothetical protein
MDARGDIFFLQNIYRANIPARIIPAMRVYESLNISILAAIDIGAVN